MKVALFSHNGRQGVGIIDDEQMLDLRDRYLTIRQFFEVNAPDKSETLFTRIQDMPRIPLAEAHLRAPISLDIKIFAIAANYHSHAQELGGDPPQQPVIFNKFYSSMVGPGEAIHISPLSEEMDYEGELAVVIGKSAYRVRATEATKYVGGYTLLNDVTARDLQQTQLGGWRVVDWFSAKALEKSSPIGPWIVTADEIAAPQDLRLMVRYNGEVVQNENTSAMVFSIAEIIEYISARLPLEPGDVIATGTPAGVGKFRDIRLKDGDQIEIEIEEIGRLENPVRR